MNLQELKLLPKQKKLKLQFHKTSIQLSLLKPKLKLRPKLLLNNKPVELPPLPQPLKLLQLPKLKLILKPLLKLKHKLKPKLRQRLKHKHKPKLRPKLKLKLLQLKLL